MENQELTLPGIVFVVLVLIFLMGLKLSPLWSVIIGLMGFGVTYFLLQGKK